MSTMQSRLLEALREASAEIGGLGVVFWGVLVVAGLWLAVWGVRHASRDGGRAAGERGMRINLEALQVALSYFLVGWLWILLSDDLLARLFPDAQDAARLQTVKGTVFVLTTGLMLFAIVRRKLIQVHASMARAAESEDTYRLLADHTLDVIWCMDRDLTFTYVNPAITSLLGYGVEEFVGSSLAQHTTPAEHRRIADLIRCEVDSEGPGPGMAFRAWVRHKDGHPVPIEILGHVLPGSEDGPMAIQGTARDITERRRAERERTHLLSRIREQVRLVQQIIHTVPEGVLLLDGERRPTLANPVALRALQVLTDATLSEPLVRLGDTPLETVLRSPPRGMWHRVSAEGRTFDVIARPLAEATEEMLETLPLDLPSAPDQPVPDVRVCEPRGPQVLVLRDVTEELERLARSQQQERLSAIGQLAAGIAHDFNNILAIILLYTQTALRAASTPAELKERLEIVVQQTKRATDLVQEILAFGRGVPLERDTLNLVPLLKETVRLLERTLPETIRTELVYESAACYVSADPGRIEQVVMNLALNARDAMPDGGTLSIGLSPLVVADGAAGPLPELTAGAWIEMTVADTGVGFEPEALAHVFEPFFTTKAPGRGTGLGLAQVYGIVKQHDGEITLESETGGGTTFSIYLPALAAPESVVDTAEPGQVQTGSGETILLVEDNEEARAAMIDALRTLDYDVLPATDGEAALGLLARHRNAVALVLSDLVMPGMGGCELLRAVRAEGSGVPVVLLTGHPLEETLGELADDGLTAWLLKPPDLAQLAETIARALGRDGERDGF